MVRSEFKHGNGENELAREYNDYLPRMEILPALTPEEVERFVALGEAGWQRFRAGDTDAALQAFQAQVRVFPGNFEPFVSMALVDGSRGAEKAAIDHLRQAVLRGFRDLQRVRRSEAWVGIGKPIALLDLIDAIPVLAAVDRRWPSWKSMVVPRAPDDLDEVLAQHARLQARIAGQAPALGPRLTALWDRGLDRAAAAMLQAYVSRHGDRPDAERAVERAMALYSGGTLSHWERLPREAARQLSAISSVLLDKYPNNSRRADALVARALAGDRERDDKGKLTDEAAAKIVSALEEVLGRHADSPMAVPALVGLVRTLVETGRQDLAAQRYRAFRDAHASDGATMDHVRDDLGDLALRLGGVPAFEARSLDGNTLEAAQLQGKVLVLDFWATWCGPCIDGLPTLRKIERKHGDDVTVVGVNMDYADDLSVEDLKAWIADRQAPGTQLHDGLSWESELVRAFGVKEIPFNVVVDSQGVVVAVNEHGKRLEKAVRTALGNGN